MQVFFTHSTGKFKLSVINSFNFRYPSIVFTPANAPEGISDTYYKVNSNIKLISISVYVITILHFFLERFLLSILLVYSKDVELTVSNFW